MPYSYRSSFSSKRGPSRGRTANRQTNRRQGQYIDPARFIRVAKPTEAEDYTPQNSFKDFEVVELIQKNLAQKGYVLPTPIQDKTIPAALAGRDIIGVADTGTGKTAAFGIPLLNKLITDSRSRALIIAPTRELAQQIQDEARSMATGSGIRGAMLIGGTSMGPQLRDLQHNPHIVIGTPGRIKDHMKRGTLKLNAFNVVVLDEVDRMLDMGFVTDVRAILSELAHERQSFFFSATLDKRVSDLIQTFSHDALLISIKTGETSENVHQNILRYDSTSEKIDKLHDLLIKNEVGKTLVFDDTQRNVERLSKQLVERGFAADAIHGGKSQGQRERALKRFKTNEVKILVATDVAARGIDVADITHVINYSTPKAYEDYIHRIGRAGRAGRIGHAITFVAA